MTTTATKEAPALAPLQVYYVQHNPPDAPMEWRATTKVADLFSLDTSDYLEFEFPRYFDDSRVVVTLNSVFEHFDNADTLPGLRRYTAEYPTLHEGDVTWHNCGSPTMSYPRYYIRHQLPQTVTDTSFPVFRKLPRLMVSESLNLPGFRRSNGDDAAQVPISSFVDATRSGDAVQVSYLPNRGDEFTNFLDILGAHGLIYCPGKRHIIADHKVAAARIRGRKSRLAVELRRQQAEKKKAEADKLEAITTGNNITKRELAGQLDAITTAVLVAISESLLDGVDARLNFYGKDLPPHASMWRCWQAFRTLQVSATYLTPLLPETWMYGHPTYKVLQAYKIHHPNLDCPALSQAIEVALSIYEWAGMLGDAELPVPL